MKRLFVAPILQTLILNRAPRATLDWVNQIASWDFQRIIPCHFQKAIAVGPEQFRQAFSFLEKQPECSNYPLPQEDFQLRRGREWKRLSLWRAGRRYPPWRGRPKRA
ncbi:MAG: DUF4336 domain-containing protein [Hormoscilla sp. GM102CHS1]|nr:DUF4336 domain-containing protein [Hormoscilla sp. GM102CHS1]